MNERNYDPVGCRRLLAAVVFLAVKDTCSKPVKKGSGALNISNKADSAFEFFFGYDDQVSELYLELLGWDPIVFKNSLVSSMNTFHTLEKKPLFTGTDKRLFKYNYLNWLRKGQFIYGRQEFTPQFNFDDLENDDES